MRRAPHEHPVRCHGRGWNSPSRSMDAARAHRCRPAPCDGGCRRSVDGALQLDVPCARRHVLTSPSQSRGVRQAAARSSSVSSARRGSPTRSRNSTPRPTAVVRWSGSGLPRMPRGKYVQLVDDRSSTARAMIFAAVIPAALAPAMALRRVECRCARLPRAPSAPASRAASAAIASSTAWTTPDTSSSSSITTSPRARQERLVVVGERVLPVAEPLPGRGNRCTAACAPDALSTAGHCRIPRRSA